MDYHQKALNISKKSNSGAGKAMAAETCVLMGMVKCKMGSFKSALNVRSYRTSLIVFMRIINYSLPQDSYCISPKRLILTSEGLDYRTSKSLIMLKQV